MTDLIFHNGTILTMDEQHPQATALALRDGEVLAVGGDELLVLRRDRTDVLDLAGRTVCPGFIDAHHHITLAAWYARGVDLHGCRSVEEAMQRIADAARSPDDGWLIAFNYTPRHFARGRGLSRRDLDRVAGQRPALVMHFSFHEAVVSTAGLRAAGIDRETPDPFGGRIVRDRRGEPTGELLEKAAGRVEALARTSAAEVGYEGWLAALESYCNRLFAAGITHLCDPGIDAMLEGFVRRANRAGRLPLPVQMLFVSRQGGLFALPTDRLDGPITGDRVDGVPVGALKLFADGGSRCAVCIGLAESLIGVGALVGRAARARRPGLLRAASAPERPQWGADHRLHVGYRHYPPGELAALCAEAHARGFQLAIHAACNAGIEAAIGALASLPRGRYRHRVEHLVSLDRDQMRRLAEIGVIGVVQPIYITQMGDEWEAMPAPTRLKSVPLHDLLDAGIALAGSSDAPVAPYQPLAGMRAAITRRTESDLVHQGDQAITPAEALRLWTTGGALAANRPGEIGVLRPGARADCIVLSANPLTTTPEQFAMIRVERTVLGGTTVYDAHGG